MTQGTSPPGPPTGGEKESGGDPNPTRVRTLVGLPRLEHLVIRKLEFVWDLGFGIWNLFYICVLNQDINLKT